MKNTNIKSMSHRRSSFEYRFKEIVLNMTKGPHEKAALMKINIYNCHGMHTSKSNDFYEIKFGIQNFEIDNPKIEKGEKNRVLKRMDSSTGGQANNNPLSEAVVINQKFFTVLGDPRDGFVNRWKVVSDFEIMIAPMVVNVTKDIYF